MTVRWLAGEAAAEPAHTRCHRRRGLSACTYALVRQSLSVIVVLQCAQNPPYLLVADLALGPGSTALQRVLHAWPGYVAYIISFLTIGAAWLRPPT